MEVEDVTITYERTLRKSNHETKKLELVKADRTTKVKLEFSMYNVRENMELLLNISKSSKRQSMLIRSSPC